MKASKIAFNMFGLVIGDLSNLETNGDNLRDFDTLWDAILHNCPIQNSGKSAQQKIGKMFKFQEFLSLYTLDQVQKGENLTATKYVATPVTQREESKRRHCRKWLNKWLHK